MPASSRHPGDRRRRDADVSPPAKSGDGSDRLDSVVVARSLDALRRSVSAREDPSLVAILDATERVASEWLRQGDRASRCHAAYREAAHAQERTAVQLGSMLRTLAELTDSRLGPEVRHGAPERRARWLRRRLRVRGERIDSPALLEDERPEPASPDFPEGTEQDATGVRESVLADTTLGPERGHVIAVHLLGEFELSIGGRSLGGWHGVKSQRVIRFLLAHHERPVPKDVLIEVFWPTVTATTGRRNLHQTVYMIRKVIRAQVPDIQLVLHDNDAYVVNPRLDSWYDTEVFERNALLGRDAERAGDLTRAKEAYRIAERCYRGDFLEDTPYEDWALTERDRLRLLYLETANQLGEMLVAERDFDSAFEVGQRVLRRDPCDERAHQRAMRCFAAMGQRNLIAQQYRACADALDREMALEPSPETTNLYSALIGNRKISVKGTPA